MKIRRPVSEVFNAMVDPKITTNFWFTKSSGIMVAGGHVQWDWEMYKVSAVVNVKEILENEKITFEWGDKDKRLVEFTFTPLLDDSTYFTAKESGYVETGAELLEIIKDSTGGFTTLLDGCKAYLEHG
ncbi:MAG TPA: SRPBCC family protein, partial [Flavobacterium sp.]